MDTLIRMHPESKVLRREVFVDQSYMVGDDGEALLFLHEFVEYRTPKGYTKRRHEHTIREFDSEDAMAEWLEGQEVSEGHTGDVPCLHWTPEGWEGAA